MQLTHGVIGGALLALLGVASVRAEEAREPRPALPAPDADADADEPPEPRHERTLAQRLRSAAWDGDVAEVERLLAAGAPVTTPEPMDSALDAVAYTAHLAVAQVLVSHGAPMATDGRHALWTSLGYEDPEHRALSLFLIEKGAMSDPDTRRHAIGAMMNRRLDIAAVRYFDLRGEEGGQLWSSMVSVGGPERYAEVTRVFLDAGLPFAPKGLSDSLLGQLARWGSMSGVELLVERGAPVDLGGHDRPLVGALSEGELAIADYLLRHGAAPRLSDAEATEVVRQLCPTPAVLDMLATRLHVGLKGPVGTRLLENGVRGCASDAASLDRAVALGADPTPLATESALLFALERSERDEAPAHLAWLTAHGVELRAEERERLRAEEAAEAARAREREAQRRAAEKLREREERARARTRALEHLRDDHHGSFAGMGVGLLLGAAAFALRERSAGATPPRWASNTLGVLTVLPGAAVGAVLGPLLGEALLGPGASSSVFSWPSGSQIGALVGPFVGGIAGLVVGIKMRDTLRTEPVAYYAVPVVTFVGSAITLAF